MPGAWEYDTVKITVGVVDEGFDFEHEDYKNNIKSKHNENIGKSPEHGTRVTGIIAAEHNNKKGLSGVNKNCDLILSEWKNPEGDAKEYVTDPVDNNDNFEITTTDMIVGETVNQIIEGAKVVNISAGSMWYEKEDDNKFNMLSHLEYIDREAEVASVFLYNLLARNYDFVIVQSAGNGFEDTMASYDAKYNGMFCGITKNNCKCKTPITAEDIIGRIIVVGASKKPSEGKYVQASWSNAGSRVDICAPGVKVFSCIPGRFMDYTIEFMDDEGNYSDTRNFYGLEVNKNTIVDTVAEPSKKTRLKVDSDGDGKYETTFVAEANQDGVIEKNLWIPMIVILVIISALVVVLYAYRRKIFNISRKNRIRRER